MAEESLLLTIHGDCTDYIIEPVRFDLGFSRVQMIDDHLARLKKDGMQSSPDVDTLLDARQVFAAWEELSAEL